MRLLYIYLKKYSGLFVLQMCNNANSHSFCCLSLNILCITFSRFFPYKACKMLQYILEYFFLNVLAFLFSTSTHIKLDFKTNYHLYMRNRERTPNITKKMEPISEISDLWVDATYVLFQQKPVERHKKTNLRFKGVKWPTWTKYISPLLWLKEEQKLCKAI